MGGVQEGRSVGERDQERRGGTRREDQQERSIERGEETKRKKEEDKSRRGSLGMRVQGPRLKVVIFLKV